MHKNKKLSIDELEQISGGKLDKKSVLAGLTSLFFLAGTPSFAYETHTPSNIPTAKSTLNSKQKVNAEEILDKIPIKTTEEFLMLKKTQKIKYFLETVEEKIKSSSEFSKILKDEVLNPFLEIYTTKKQEYLAGFNGKELIKESVKIENAMKTKPYFVISKFIENEKINETYETFLAIIEGNFKCEKKVENETSLKTLKEFKKLSATEKLNYFEKTVNIVIQDKFYKNPGKIEKELVKEFEKKIEPIYEHINNKTSQIYNQFSQKTSELDYESKEYKELWDAYNREVISLRPTEKELNEMYKITLDILNKLENNMKEKKNI